MENFEELFLKKDKAKSNLRIEYEKLLWIRADEISRGKREIEEERESIYAQMQAARGKILSYPEKMALENKEGQYWELDKELRVLLEEEKTIQDSLEKMEAGMLSDEEIRETLAKIEHLEIPGLSKRKQRIQEEREKNDFDSRNADYETRDRFGTEKNRITTGHNLKHWKGNAPTYDPLSVSADFHNQTSGTHGGKTDTGKKGNIYVGKSGKIIRKV